MPKESYHHEDLKMELIQAGLKLLDQEGYDKFSMRKVASACNVSQTAPYRHYRDKDELITAITAEALRAFNETLETSVENNPDDPEKQLLEMGVAYIKFFTENPEYLRLIFLSDIRYRMKSYSGNCQENPGYKDPFQTFYMAEQRYIEACPGCALSQSELLLYCWGLVHGIAVLISNKDIPFEGDYLELARNIIKNGFRALEK
jgi:AcrR family transcriptional regulator